MHDWSETYVAPWGWLPADASYGLQESVVRRIAEFYCGHQDSYRMVVNLDCGRELFPPKTLCIPSRRISNAARWRWMAEIFNSTSGTRRPKWSGCP